jgi:hypothetical protein
MTKKRGERENIDTVEGDGDLADPSPGGEASSVLAEGEEVGPWSDDESGSHASAGDEADEEAEEEEEEEEDEDEDEDEEDTEVDELQIWEASDLDLQGDDDEEDPGRSSATPGGSRR